MNFLSIFILPLLAISGLSSANLVSPKNSNPDLRTLEYGEFFEAEDGDYTNCSIIDNNKNASNKEALDAGDGGYVTFNFKVEETGYYDLVVGYYTDNMNAKIGVNVNGTQASYPVKYTNGWCKDTDRYAIEHIIRDVELFSDENSIKISSDNIGQSKYLNFDYIRLVKPNKVGNGRVQFEDYYRYIGGDGYGRPYIVATNADGKALSLDDNISAKPVYSLEIEEAGTYFVQFAYYSNTDAKYNFKFTNNDDFTFNQNISIPRAVGGFTDPNNNYFPYSAKHGFEIELPEGKVDFGISYIKNGFVDFDWFKIYQKTDVINSVLEAEDYTWGDANINRHSSQYPVLSDYAVELAQGHVEFDVNVPETGLYRLYIAGYTATQGAYLNISVDGAKQKYEVPPRNATGWTTEVYNPNIFYFNFELTEGKHTFKIQKGGDEIAGNYIDLDYFMVIPNRVHVEEIVLDSGANSKFIIDDSVIDFASEYTLSVKDKNVAKLENGVLTALTNGKTALVITYHINGVEMNEEIPVRVAVGEYEDKSDFEVKNTTRTYNGERQYVDVVMPEGWTFTQTGDAPMAGTYLVTVTFHHPNYADYVYPAVITLTIVKGVYEGTDLYADDQTIQYDGEEHQYVATAPAGWTISYSDNGFKEIGEYTITVTFTHEYYETVVKTARFIIEPKKSGGDGYDSTPLIVTLSVIGGVVALGVAGFIFYKKYKENHEVIK